MCQPCLCICHKNYIAATTSLLTVLWHIPYLCAENIAHLVSTLLAKLPLSVAVLCNYGRTRCVASVTQRCDAMQAGWQAGTSISQINNAPYKSHGSDSYSDSLPAILSSAVAQLPRCCFCWRHTTSSSNLLSNSYTHWVTCVYPIHPSIYSFIYSLEPK